MKTYILITEAFDFHTKLELLSDPRWSIIEGKVDDQPPDILEQIEVIIIRSKTQVTNKLLERLPRLRLIISTTSGFDHFDPQVWQQFPQIKACYTPEAHSLSVAELTVALILELLRKTPESRREMKQGLWRSSQILGEELSGRTLGVVGLGRIGQKLVKLLQGWDLIVYAYDPYQSDTVFEDLKVKRVSFPELLRLSKIITFHVPLTAETHSMLKPEHKDLMDHGVYIVNTSRGAVLDLEILQSGFKEGWLLGAALDVFPEEPLDPQSPLLKNPKVVYTPHIGAWTKDALYRASQAGKKQLLRWVEGLPLEAPLPPCEPWYTNSPFWLRGTLCRP